MFNRLIKGLFPTLLLSLAMIIIDFLTTMPPFKELMVSYFKQSTWLVSIIITNLGLLLYNSYYHTNEELTLKTKTGKATLPAAELIRHLVFTNNFNVTVFSKDNYLLYINDRGVNCNLFLNFKEDNQLQAIGHKYVFKHVEKFIE